jgi:hypothetical protein
MLAGAPARAANVRIVQKGVVDPSGHIHGTIQDALKSITDASPANRYLLQIMPGVYDLGTASLELKPHVDVQGSGSENTVITSSVGGAFQTCTGGTVVMAAESSIRDLRIVNRGPANGAPTNATALVFRDVKATARDVAVEAGSDAADDGAWNTGVCVAGALADASLDGVRVDVRNRHGASVPIMVIGGRVAVSGSRLTAMNTSRFAPGCTVVYDAAPFGTPSTVAIANSTLEGSCSSVLGVLAGSMTVSIAGSTMTLTSTYGGSILPFFLASTTDLTMTGSRIVARGAVAEYRLGDATVRIATSQLTGNLEFFHGGKLVHVYDENFAPVPDM